MNFIHKALVIVGVTLFAPEGVAAVSSIRCRSLFDFLKVERAEELSLYLPEDDDRYFFRVVFSGGIRVDAEGYLVSHSGELDKDGVALVDISEILATSVPLVEPREWETIARLFAFPRWKSKGQSAYLLKIRKDWVLNLSYVEHGMLEGYEYFGSVPVRAIEQVIEFGWERSRRLSINMPLEILNDDLNMRLLRPSFRYHPVPRLQP